MGLTNQQQAVLVAIAFVLMAIYGFLQQQTFIADNLVINIAILAIPIALLSIKELAGSAPGPDGVLTDQQQAALVSLATTLLVIGAALTATTSNPYFLFALGLVGAALMGLKEWLGSAPPTA